MSRITNSLVLILSLAAFAAAQKVISKPATSPATSAKPASKTSPNSSAATQIPPLPKISGKSSAAFAELALRKAELDSDLKDLLQDYTEEYPETKKKKTEIDLLQIEMNNLAKVDGAKVPKLTVAVGKLLIKKVQLKMELETLRADYTDEYPLVQKTKRRLESFEDEIKELLQ